MLKNLRKKAGLTQVELAAKLGVSQVTIVHYEKGNKKPEMDRVPKMAKILGVSIEELYGDKTPKQHNNKSAAHGNSRLSKMQEMFQKLPLNEQRVVLKQIKLLAEK